MKFTYKAMKNGKMTTFNVPQEKLNKFLEEYPDATRVEGKNQSSAEDATAEQNPTASGSQSENTSSDLQLEKNNILKLEEQLNKNTKTLGNLRDSIQNAQAFKNETQYNFLVQEYNNVLEEHKKLHSNYKVKSKSFNDNLSKAQQKPQEKEGDDITNSDDFENSEEELTWLEQFAGKNQFTDLVSDIFWRAPKAGWEIGSGTSESLNLFEKGADMTDEERAELIKALDRVDKGGKQIDEMRRASQMMQKYKEEGKSGFTSWLYAYLEDPTTLLSYTTQNVVQMGRALVDDPSIFFDAIGNGIEKGLMTGAVGATAGSVVPGLGTIAGGVAGFKMGFVPGVMGQISESMEKGMTTVEFFKEEAQAQGLNWESMGVQAKAEFIKKISEDKDTFGDIKSRALARGETIGTIDTITGIVTMGLGKGLTKTLPLTTLSKRTVGITAGATATTETAGGLISEIEGQKAAGQEFNLEEVLLEGFADKTFTGVTVAKGLVSGNPKYILNKQELNGKQFSDALKLMDDEAFIDADIKIENSPSVQRLIDNRTLNIQIDQDIDSRVSDSNDRAKIIKLEKKKARIKARQKNNKINTKSGSKLLADIDNEINEITSKYENSEVDVTIEDRKKAVAKALETKIEKQYNKNIKFAEQEVSRIGKTMKVVKDFVLGKDGKYTSKQMQKFVDIYNEANPDSKPLTIQEAMESDGFFLPDGTLVVNEFVAKKSGQINVGAHELLHGVIQKQFQALRKAGNTSNFIKSFRRALTSEQDAAILKEINRRISAGEDIDVNTTEEWLTVFSDMLTKGQLTFNEGKFDKFLNWLNELLSNNKIYNFNKRFGSGREAYNFMKDYQASIEKNKLSDRIVETAKTDVKVEPGKAKPKTTKEESKKVEFSRSDAKGPIDKLGRIDSDGNDMTEAGVGNFLYQAEADEVVRKIKEEGYLDNLIAAKYKVRPVPQDFVQDVLAELTPHIKAFKPESNNSLFGWIQGQIANKASRVYNTIYKDKGPAKTVNVDATTSEGAPVVQLEADTDTEIIRFEEMDLSKKEVQQRSKLRRDLKLDKPMITRIKQAVIKTFGTKLPDVQAKDFRAALQKAFRTELKKPIQDMMGGRTEYDSFLTNHFEAIYKALPVETLVQMERNLKPERRIFTSSRRITKPSEVDKLISQGRLPKNTNRNSGPQLHTKKPMPSMDKVMAFFRGTDMEANLGYKVGASTLGTRKDKLAMSLAEELAFDATSEVLQDPAVKAKRQGILEIQGYDSKNDLVKVAEKIDRDPNVKFSKSEKKAAELKNVAELNFNKLQENLGFTIPGIFKRIPYIGATGKEKFRNMMDWGRELRIGNALSTLAEHTSEVLDTFLNNNPEFIFDFRKSTTGGQGISTFGVTSMFDSMFKTAELGAKLFSRFGYSVKGKLLGQNKIKTENGKKLFKVDKKWVSEKEFVKLQDKKLDVLESLFVAIQNHLKKNPNHAWFFFRLIGDSVNNQDHMVRVSAPMKGAPIDNKGKLVHDQKIAEEHQLPQNQVGKMLLHAAVTGQSIPDVMKVVRASYAQIALLETDDVKTRQAGYSSKMPAIFWDKVVPRIIDGSLKIADGLASIVRYTASGVNLNNYTLFGMDQTVTEYFGVNVDLKNKTQQQIDAIVEKQNALIDQQVTGEITKQQATEQAAKFSKSNAIIYKEGARTRSLAMKAEANLVKYSKSGKSKGMSTFDFDETLIIDGENFIVATDPKTGQVIEISSGDWPLKGPELAAAGFEFDFSDFANVRGGKEGPLLQKMKNQIAKYGNKNVFVLTARQQDSAVPIQQWLKSQGINIPLRNITGLGKSEGSAKGEWMLQKFAEGYNDMYFVDDALPNVEAVKKVLDQLDIKSKVVQAKVKFSKSASQDFNNMLDRSKGVKSDTVISDVDAKLRGAKRDRFKLRFFVPPSAEDFKGLVYAFLGKGEQGNKDMQWFKDNLFTPFAEGTKKLNSLRQKMSEEYTALKKQFPDVVKSLNDKVANTEFTVDNAVRVYLWNMAGFDVPGLSDAQKKLLIDHVAKNAELVAFADVLSNITRTEEGYIKPKDYWVTQNIGSDLHTVAETINREKFLTEWQENADLVFSKENLNKIEAIYGTNFREALEDMLYRMKTGSNRPSGRTSVENKFLNWVNGAVSAVMFFNMRSAGLQGLSMVNFLNFEDNNIFKASKAFANQKQFWGDFIYLFNSDMLKQRRAGLKIDVSASELTDAFAQGKNKTEAVIKYLLEKGFIPTKMMDSFAIAMGGSTFYRNRVEKLIKQGMSKTEAENQAFLDFQEIAEETQQSSRPDLISMQQASSLGRLILAWANTPMQYTRLTKKALSDIINRRGDTKANVSRILYYGAIQNIIFGTLQTGLAFLMFGDDEEDENRDKKEQRVLNGMLDTLLRGVGVYGALVSAAKNTLIAAHEELGKGFGKKDYSKIMQQLINLSPPIGSKVRKIIGAIKSYDFNKDIIDQMDHGINNPAWNVFTGVVEGITNAPLDRIRAKMVNVREAFVGDHEMWQRIALVMGWNKWDLNVRDAQIDDARQQVKDQKKKNNKKKVNKKTKTYQCRFIKKNGNRCKNTVTTFKNQKCYAHK